MSSADKAVHFVVLGLWGILGIVYSFKIAFAFVPEGPIFQFWGWWAGYALLTSLVTRPFSSGGTVALIHALMPFGMALIPRGHVLTPCRMGLEAALSLWSGGLPGR